jgi:hypothetical protein
MDDAKSIAPLDEMDRLARTFLDLKQWGFQENVRLEKNFPIIVYQSEWCRMKFTWGGWEMSGEYTIGIDYGRLHAPPDNVYIMWNGEKCYCWHNITYALHFLDGYSPEDVASKNYQRPRLMEQFRQSEVGQSLRGRRHQPEWLVRMHGALWEHYGVRVFELFDLRRPHLWEKYRQFMKELYDIEGRSPNIKPPLDSVC